MKRNSVIVILVTIFFSCQNQQKIGFVDNGKVINEYQEKKDVEEKYGQKEQAFKNRTDSISKAFQLEAQEVQLKASSMSQSKQQEQYQMLGQKQKMLQQQIQFEQQQMQQGYQTEMDSIISKVKKYVKEYGKNNGYNYILGTSDNTATVMYGNDSTDISQTIIDSLNVIYAKEKK